jgi:hypothetical protein
MGTAGDRLRRRHLPGGAPLTQPVTGANADTLRPGSHVFGGRAVMATPKHREEG